MGERLTQVELIRNGEIVKTFKVPNPKVEFSAEFDLTEEKTAWYIARCIGSSRDQIAITSPIYFAGADYQPAQPTLANLTGSVTDKATGKPLDEVCEVIDMVGLSPSQISKHGFKDGKFKLQAPGTYRVLVRVPNYAPMAKSILMDYAPLTNMTLKLRSSELIDWTTFQQIRTLLQQVHLEFALIKSQDSE